MSRTSNIKVQIPGVITSSAIINHGIPEGDLVLTFMAFSDAMKARILERIAKGDDIRVSLTNEPIRTGEWFEPLHSDSVAAHN